MPSRAARIMNTIDVPTLFTKRDAAAAIGFPKTRDRLTKLLDITGRSLWSFEFYGNEETADRRLSPRGNSGVSCQQGKTRRF